MLQKRRRSLLTLASYGTWDFDLASFPYVHNSLLPNGSEVVKGKIAKIYANGVIENQLYEMAQNHITGSGVSYTYADNKITFTCTVQGGNRGALNHVSFVNGHKYLISCVLTQSVTGTCRFQMFNHNYSQVFNGDIFSLTANVKQKCSFIATSNFTDSEDATNISLYMLYNGTTQVGDSLVVENAMCIDLTKMFGTGNEPTTLSDNRIQSILNRVYIAYNTGSLKSTNVGEIATEPYNLFDEQTELGRLDLTTGENYADSSQIRAKNYISVVGRETYTMEIIGGNSQIAWAMFYDKNKNVIAGVNTGTSVASNARAWNNGISITMPNNCCYVRFYLVTAYGTTYLNNICIHRTGTRTGYAEHKPSASIPFIYQGNGALNAHDTFEITSSEYVFTKNIGSVDLGSLSYGSSQSYGYYSSSLSSIAKRPSNNNIIPNIVCSKFATNKRNDSGFSSFGNNIITFDVDGDLDISYTQGLTITQFVSEVAGIPLYFELATPQVTRIPRKHLGIVDLGTITTGYVTNGVYYIGGNDQSFGIDVASSNANGYACYCSKFLRANGNEVYNKTNDNTICLTSPFIGNNLAIYSSSFTGKTADEIRALLSGTYLFYETNEEVEDIATRIFTENGGTVTTDSEVLPNLDLDLPVKV